MSATFILISARSRSNCLITVIVLKIRDAFKYLDKNVKCFSGFNESGFKLMMAAFGETNPTVRLTALSTQSEFDEQFGFEFNFAGSMSAIRN